MYKFFAPYLPSYSLLPTPPPTLVPVLPLWAGLVLPSCSPIL
jgi:hypothetical protein